MSTSQQADRSQCPLDAKCRMRPELITPLQQRLASGRPASAGIGNRPSEQAELHIGIRDVEQASQRRRDPKTLILQDVCSRQVTTMKPDADSTLSKVCRNRQMHEGRIDVAKAVYSERSLMRNNTALTTPKRPAHEIISLAYGPLR